MILLLLSTLSAFGGSGDGLTLGVGGGWFWTTPNESLDDTWTVVPRLGYSFTPKLGVEADVGLLQGSTRTATNYRYDALTPRLNLLYTPFPDWPVRPFVAAGPGAIRKNINRISDAVEDEPKRDGLENYKNPNVNLLLNGGPGVVVPLGRYFGLRSDLRYTLDIGDATDDGRQLYSDWEWTAGIVITPFAKPADKDADGIVDDLDVCPYEAETRNGVRDEDGCPEAPEVLAAAATTSASGAPAVAMETSDDADGDGLASWEDSCPNDPEDEDGFEDSDGCPEPDDDSDGVLDADDDCPREAETDNGFDDDDGCPDDVPEVFEEVSGVVRGITFESGSATLQPQSTAVLEKVFLLLWEYPELMLTIEGHTDDVGDRAFNLDLSQDRADAVLAWLDRRGIDKERMATEGYGPDEPMVENTSEENRAENRRVELNYTNVTEEEP